MSETCRSRYTIICGCIFLVERKWKRESTTTKKKTLHGIRTSGKIVPAFTHTSAVASGMQKYAWNDIYSFIEHMECGWRSVAHTHTIRVETSPTQSQSISSQCRLRFFFFVPLDKSVVASASKQSRNELVCGSQVQNLYFLLSTINVPGCLALDDYRDTYPDPHTRTSPHVIPMLWCNNSNLSDFYSTRRQTSNALVWFRREEFRAECGIRLHTCVRLVFAVSVARTLALSLSVQRGCGISSQRVRILPRAHTHTQPGPFVCYEYCLVSTPSPMQVFDW